MRGFCKRETVGCGRNGGIGTRWWADSFLGNLLAISVDCRDLAISAIFPDCFFTPHPSPVPPTLITIFSRLLCFIKTTSKSTQYPYLPSLMNLLHRALSFVQALPCKVPHLTYTTTRSSGWGTWLNPYPTLRSTFFHFKKWEQNLSCLWSFTGAAFAFAFTFACDKYHVCVKPHLSIGAGNIP